MAHTDLAQAAEAAIEALRGHADLLLADPYTDVRSASAVLADAIEGYCAAVVASGAPPLEELEEVAETIAVEWTEEEIEEEPLPPGARLSIWKRSDFVVTDPDRLMSTARARSAELAPDDPEDVERSVYDVKSAVRELLHHEDHEVLGAYYGEESGLQPAGATTRIMEVERALEDYPDDEWLFDDDFDPFDLEDQHE